MNLHPLETVCYDFRLPQMSPVDVKNILSLTWSRVSSPDDINVCIAIELYVRDSNETNLKGTRKTTYASVCESRTKQTRKKVTGVTRQ